MLKAPVVSVKGVKLGVVSLPTFAEEKPNLFVLAQAIRVYEDRLHPGLAKVQTRAEVNRTKKKWYRQKGTGGARHGAKSAPIFVGGGVAHGPKGIKRTLGLSQKIAQKALRTAISLKAKSGELLVVSQLNTLKKTKDAAVLLEKIGKSLGRTVKRATFVLAPENKDAKRALLNIQKIKVSPIFDINAYLIYKGGVILFDKDALSSKRPQKLEKEDTKETKVEAKKEVKKPKTVKKAKKAVKKIK